MEWHPEFAAGRARIQVSFTGGHLCGGASTPATCVTSDPVVQTVIERSGAFRSGRIRLARCVGQPHAGEPREGTGQEKPVYVPEAPGETATTLTVLEASDLDEAIETLHYDKGIAMDRLLTKESCREAAAELGIDVRFK